MKYQDGFAFFDYQMKGCTVEGFDEKYQSYLIRKEDNDTSMLDLWSEEQIDRVMTKQEDMIRFEKQQQELKRQQQEKEQAEQAKYNDVHGYCDNMSQLQRSKVLATLNKPMNHNGNVVARKEWVREQLACGYTPEYKENVNFAGRKTKNYYTLSCPDGTWFEVTKTEYDYAVYLQNNVTPVAIEELATTVETVTATKQQYFNAEIVYGGMVKTTGVWAMSASEAWEKLHFKHDNADEIYIMVNGERTSPGMVVSEETHDSEYTPASNVQHISTKHGMMIKWDEGNDLQVVYIIETTRHDEEVDINFSNLHNKECATLGDAMYIMQEWQKAGWLNINIMTQIKKGDAVIVEDIATDVEYTNATEGRYEKENRQLRGYNEAMSAQLDKHAAFLCKYNATKQFETFEVEPQQATSGVHWYELTLRGVAPGCQPRGFIEVDHNKGRHGIVAYDRTLTEAELDEYEMRPYAM